MIELMVLVGLLFTVCSLLLAYAQNTGGDEEAEIQASKGLAIAFAVVSAFLAGGWVVSTMVINLLDANVAAMGGWLAGLSLLLMLLYGLDGRRKTS